MNEINAFLTPILLAAFSAIGWFFIKRVISKIDELKDSGSAMHASLSKFQAITEKDVGDMKARLRRIERQNEALLAMSNQVIALEEDVSLLKESNFGSKTTN
jgi:HAMP domain-containing protein